MNITGAGKIMTPLQLERHKTLKMAETEAAATSHIQTFATRVLLLQLWPYSLIGLNITPLARLNF